MIEERYDLAIGRIGRIGGEESVKLPFRKFFQKTASFLLMIDELKKERDEAVTALAERDATVSEMNATLSEKNAEIAKLKAQLAERNK